MKNCLPNLFSLAVFYQICFIQIAFAQSAFPTIAAIEQNLRIENSYCTIETVENISGSNKLLVKSSCNTFNGQPAGNVLVLGPNGERLQDDKFSKSVQEKEIMFSGSDSAGNVVLVTRGKPALNGTLVSLTAGLNRILSNGSPDTAFDALAAKTLSSVQLETMHSIMIQALAVSPDGKVAVSIIGQPDGVLLVLDSSGTLQKKINSESGKSGGNSEIKALSFVEDGLIVETSYYTANRTTTETHKLSKYTSDMVLDKQFETNSARLNIEGLKSVSADKRRLFVRAWPLAILLIHKSGNLELNLNDTFKDSPDAPRCSFEDARFSSPEILILEKKCDEQIKLIRINLMQGEADSDFSKNLQEFVKNSGVKTLKMNDVDSSGRLLINTKREFNFELFRILPDGRQDPTFHTGTFNNNLKAPRVLGEPMAAAAVLVQGAIDLGTIPKIDPKELLKEREKLSVKDTFKDLSARAKFCKERLMFLADAMDKKDTEGALSVLGASKRNYIFLQSSSQERLDLFASDFRLAQYIDEQGAGEGRYLINFRSPPIPKLEPEGNKISMNYLPAGRHSRTEICMIMSW